MERWWAICHPLKFRATMSRARKTVLCVWLVAGAAALPELIVADIEPYSNPTWPPTFSTVYLTKCRPGWDADNIAVFATLQACVFYVLPMVLMAATYRQVAGVLWSRDVPSQAMSVRHNGSMDAMTGQEEQVLARRKAARMLIAIVVMFAVCYLPVHLFGILRYAGVINLTPTVYDPAHAHRIQSMVLLFHWLPYFNSSLNPVIYNFMSAKFRKEFKSACFGCFRGMHNQPFRRGGRNATYSMKFSNSTYSNCQTDEFTMVTSTGI